MEGFGSLHAGGDEGKPAAQNKARNVNDLKGGLWQQPSRSRLSKQGAWRENGGTAKWQNEPKPKNLIISMQALRGPARAKNGRITQLG
jgi:hypothetical protein